MWISSETLKNYLQFTTQYGSLISTLLGVLHQSFQLYEIIMLHLEYLPAKQFISKNMLAICGLFPY